MSVLNILDINVACNITSSKTIVARFNGSDSIEKEE